jgi:hypothetical protein
MSRGWRSDGQEVADLVVECRRSGAVPEAVVAEAERLYAAGEYNEAPLACSKGGLTRRDTGVASISIDTVRRIW